MALFQPIEITFCRPFSGSKSNPFRPNLGTLCPPPPNYLPISLSSASHFPLLAFHPGFSSPASMYRKNSWLTVRFFPLDGPLSARWDDGVLWIAEAIEERQRERGGGRWRSSVEKIYDGETGRFIGLRELRLWREVFYSTKFTLDLFPLFFLSLLASFRGELIGVRGIDGRGDRSSKETAKPELLTKSLLVVQLLF